jgi:hypothetical protein
MTVISPKSSRHSKRLVRTAGLVLGAVAVAGGAFLAVLHFQPAIAPAATAGRPSVAPAAVGPAPQLFNGMASGDAPWVNSYDGGRLSSQFKADEYTPRKDGTVSVLHPKARFYLGGGRCLQIIGDTGEVAFDSPAGGRKGGGMPTESTTPDTGKLHHVHIALFPTNDADPPARPTLTMDTDNVRFDNDTLRLFTEPYTDADGHVVAADRVPVVVRGDDYAMDGTGLTLRLSEGRNLGDRQLHLLEVAHGIRLTLLHPGAALGPGGGDRAAASAASPTLRPAPPVPVPPSTPPVVASGVTPASRPALATTTPAAPQLYRAVFRDHVRIAQRVAGQPDQTIGLGDVLTLDMLQKSSGAKPAGTVPSVGSPTPAVAPVPATAPTLAATPPAASQPAGAAGQGKLGSEPITIYWTGTLRVTPVDPAAALMPLDGGQAALRLAGRPAMLSFNGATAKAATATYRTVDDAVRLEPSAECPVVQLAQPVKGLALDARSVAFDPATSVATIVGPATMRVAEAGHATTMTATWTERGLLHVVNAGADPAGVDHVDLMGDVRADDPRFSLVGRRLLLDLDLLPPTTRPAAGEGGGGSREQLRRMTAVGNVVCRLLRPGQPDQGIEGDRLVIGMATGPDGTAAPRTVLADGRQVRAYDAEQALFADHLEAVLAPKAPTTKPAEGGMAAVSLDTLYATGHVRAALKNGSTAASDTLRETTAADGREFIELSAPAGAHVVDAKHDELVGSVLHVTDQGVVVVDGPGTLHSTGKPTTQPAGGTGGRPIDVSWTDGLTFDSVANTADVVGHVLVRSVGADGTVTTAVGDTAHLDLLDTAKDAKAPPGDTLGAKTLKALTLAGHMSAKSELDLRGVVVHHGELFGDRLVYTAGDGMARVPGPGKLFVENHPQPTTGPAVTGAGGKFGVMAVGWKGGLAYDTAAGRITITGDTRVGFQQDVRGSTEGGPIQMRSDELVIFVQKGTGADAGKSQVSRLLATGAVHVRARTMDMDCHTADFDPRVGKLVAKGSDAEPGRATDAAGRGIESVGGGFGELEFDTNQQEVVGVRDMHGSFRR